MVNGPYDNVFEEPIIINRPYIFKIFSSLNIFISCFRLYIKVSFLISVDTYFYEDAFIGFGRKTANIKTEIKVVIVSERKSIL